MANDLSSRRKSLSSARHPSSAGFLWKIGIPLLFGLAVLVVLSQRQGYSPGFVHSTTTAQVQVSNCSHAAPAGGNVTCNCPPSGNITNGAGADGVLRLANKVSSTTVANILDAASTDQPAERTVRVGKQYLPAAVCIQQASSEMLASGVRHSRKYMAGRDVQHCQYGFSMAPQARHVLQRASAALSRCQALSLSQQMTSRWTAGE